MSEKGCCQSTADCVILACSGASNVGQLTNEAGKRLDEECLGRFFCLAGVGGHIQGMIASVQSCGNVLVIDGCPAGCAKSTMEQAGLYDHSYLIVTDLGVDKKHNFQFSEREIEAVMSKCRSLVVAREEPS